MTVYRRRLLCLVLALSMILTLIPAATGSRNSAYAEADRKGITLDKVNMRYGAGSDQKIAFTLPANHVCTILDTKTVQNVLWYKVETIDPARKNSNKYTGYIHGDFFRELTAEEAALYVATGNSATPTPVPVSNGGAPTPTPTPVPAAGNVDLPAAAGSIGFVTAGGTNLREGPGTGYHSITRLDRNTQVELLTIPSIRGGGANTFFKVKYGNSVGYIMSDFISILSGGPENGTSVAVTPVPASPVSAATPAPNTTAYTHVKLTLSSCHLRVTPDGDYDPNNDWTGKGTVLLIAGNPVKKGSYTWYPVSKDGKTYYVRNDCVQPYTDSSAPAVTPAPATAAPATAAPATATPIPNDTQYGMVQLILTSCHLRTSPDGPYDPKNDWEGRGSVLMLTGNPVTKGKYSWYPVRKDGKTYYVRNDCVQPLASITATPLPADVTATPAPAADTATPAPAAVTPVPANVSYTHVRLVLTSCHLRSAPEVAAGQYQPDMGIGNVGRDGRYRGGSRRRGIGGRGRGSCHVRGQGRCGNAGQRLDAVIPDIIGLTVLADRIPAVFSLGDGIPGQHQHGTAAFPVVFRIIGAVRAGAQVAAGQDQLNHTVLRVVGNGGRGCRGCRGGSRGGRRGGNGRGTAVGIGLDAVVPDIVGFTVLGDGIPGVASLFHRIAGDQQDGSLARPVVVGIIVSIRGDAQVAAGKGELHMRVGGGVGRRGRGGHRGRRNRGDRNRGSVFRTAAEDGDEVAHDIAD